MGTKKIQNINTVAQYSAQKAGMWQKMQLQRQEWDLKCNQNELKQ